MSTSFPGLDQFFPHGIDGDRVFRVSTTVPEGGSWAGLWAASGAALALGRLARSPH